MMIELGDDDMGECGEAGLAPGNRPTGSATQAIAQHALMRNKSRRTLIRAGGNQGVASIGTKFLGSWE